MLNFLLADSILHHSKCSAVLKKYNFTGSETRSTNNTDFNNMSVIVYFLLYDHWPNKPLMCSLLFSPRKKKKDKESKHRMEQVVTNQNDEEVKTKKTYLAKRTPAQVSFDKMQEKRVCYIF